MRKNRQNNEMRSVEFEPDFVPYALGSILVRFGVTTVLCNVSIEDSVPRHLLGTQKGWITAEYAMLPQSGLQRSARDGRPNVKGRVHEIQRLIGRSLRAGLNLDLLGPRTITVDCDVLIADGGTRTAAITGSWIALRMALWKYFQGLIPAGLIVADYVAAVSVGLVDDCIYLDLDYDEDSSAEVDLNLIGADSGGWIEIQGTSESRPQSPSVFEGLIRTASDALPHLFNLQHAVLVSKQCL